MVDVLWSLLRWANNVGSGLGEHLAEACAFNTSMPPKDCQRD